MSDEPQEQRDSAAAEIVVARRQQTPDVVTRYPGMQSQREVFTAAGGAMPAAAIAPHAFVTRSLRVDNFSAQWLHIGAGFDFVPPFTYGWIRNVRGVGTVTATPEAPPTVALAPVVNGQTYAITLYDKPQLERDGTVYACYADWYDRNPIPISQTDGNAAGQHNQTLRFTYTVPTGRRFRIGSAFARITRTVAAGGNAQAAAFVEPLGVASIVNALILGPTLGLNDHSEVASDMTLTAGQQIQGYTYDITDVGGTVQWLISINGTEYDA